MIRSGHAATRVFARRYGEVLREVAIRTHPDTGDPAGSLIRQAADIYHIALGSLATIHGASLSDSMFIAMKELVEDKRSFMDTDLGHRLLYVEDFELGSNKWRTNVVAGLIEQAYPEIV